MLWCIVISYFHKAIQERLELAYQSMPKPEDGSLIFLSINPEGGRDKDLSNWLEHMDNGWYFAGAICKNIIVIGRWKKIPGVCTWWEYNICKPNFFLFEEKIVILPELKYFLVIFSNERKNK